MVLITGATGLVGSHLLYALLKREQTVRATKRKSSNLKDVSLTFSFYGADTEKLLSAVDWVDVDLLNPAAVDELFVDVDRVFHCAAAVSFNPKDEHKMVEINPAITANLVNAALHAGVKHFAHVSSVAAIGRSKNGTEEITEKTEWQNSEDNSKYAIGKYLSELEVWRGIEEGLPAAMVNPTIIFGPGNWNNSSNTIFKRFSKPFPFYTKGGNGFVDVRDVVDALLIISDNNIIAQRFILVSENKSYKEIGEKLADAYGNPAPKNEAKSWQLELVWRFEKLKSSLTGKDPLLTKETAQTSQKTWRYSNIKAVTELGINFRKLDKSLVEFVSFYKRLAN